jgi:phosphomannomutase
MKFLNSTGVFLDADENAALFALADEAAPQPVAWDALGGHSVAVDALDAHIGRVLAIPFLDIAAIQARGFRIAVDAVNASGSVVVPRLLELLGCEVIPVACDGSGRFPHTPEPLPENLVSLGEAVREEKADLGIAVDPDADRLVLFTEEGKPFGEEYSITTAVESVLSSMPGAGGASVVVNLSTTRAVDDVAARYGAQVLRSPVGEINVVKTMRAHDAVIGGEGSGGVILPEVHAGRDCLVGIALVLHALARHEGSASAYRASLPDYVIRKFKYSIEGMDTVSVLERARQSFAGERLNSDDGVRIDFAHGWVHLRSSNTEPIMRIIAEAPSDEQAVELARGVATQVFGADAVSL